LNGGFVGSAVKAFLGLVPGSCGGGSLPKRKKPRSVFAKIVLAFVSRDEHLEEREFLSGFNRLRACTLSLPF